MKKMIVAGCVSAALMPVLAQADWYVGAGAGSSKASLSDFNVEVAGATASSLSKDENSTGYKLFVGYNINRTYAVEGGWIDLGEASEIDTVIAPANGAITVKMQASGFNLDMVQTSPINTRLSMLLRVGAVMSQTKDTRTTTGPVVVSGAAEIVEKTTQFHFGVGLQYDINKRWGVRGEWERTRVRWFGDGKPVVDLISVGTAFKL